MCLCFFFFVNFLSLFFYRFGHAEETPETHPNIDDDNGGPHGGNGDNQGGPPGDGGDLNGGGGDNNLGEGGPDGRGQGANGVEDNIRPPAPEEPAPEPPTLQNTPSRFFRSVFFDGKAPRSLPGQFISMEHVQDFIPDRKCTSMPDNIMSLIISEEEEGGDSEMHEGENSDIIEGEDSEMEGKQDNRRDSEKPGPSKRKLNLNLFEVRHFFLSC